MSKIEDIANIYTSRRMTVENKIKTLSGILFYYPGCKLTKDARISKTIQFIIELNGELLMPNFDPMESELYNPDFIVNCLQKDYKKINKLKNLLNDRVEAYQEKHFPEIQSQFADVFEEYCKYIHPSNANRGNLSHRQVNELRANKNKVIEDNKELFDLIKETCRRNNIGVTLFVMVANELFKLRELKDGSYQMNLRNAEVLAIVKKYCKLTNTKDFTNFFAKITLIRTCMNELTHYCFQEKYDIELEEHEVFKYHNRLVCRSKGVRHSLSIHSIILLHKSNNKLYKYNSLSSLLCNKKIKDYINIMKGCT